MDKKIRVLIADDHAVVRLALSTLLATVDDVEVVAEAADGNAAIQQALHTRPDVILLDIMMPRKTGIEALPELRRVVPDCQCLVLSSHLEDDQMLAAIRAGADGYLLKEVTAEELVAAVRNAFHRRATIYPVIARRLLQELSSAELLPHGMRPLTVIQAEVLTLIARGHNVAEVAAHTGLDEQAVYDHVGSILNRMRM